jgi:hypothetical protein
MQRHAGGDRGDQFHESTRVACISGVMVACTRSSYSSFWAQPGHWTYCIVGFNPDPGADPPGTLWQALPGLYYHHCRYRAHEWQQRRSRGASG